MNEYRFGIVFIVVILNLISYTESQKLDFDPCESSPVIPNVDSRYLFNRITEDEPRMNDDSSLPSGWYTSNGIRMLTKSPTGAFMCGTKFPVFLKGDHPAGVNEEIEEEACVYAAHGLCSFTFPIRIRKCADDSFRYQLQKLPYDNAAYCFGEGIDGERTDYVPEVKNVTFGLEEKTDPIQSRVVFFCNFDASTEEPDLFYRVTWYMNKKALYLSPFGRAAVDHGLALTEELFVAYGFKLGNKISCDARAFKEENGPSGKLSEKSPEIFVGIEIENPLIEFQRNSPEAQRTIRFKTTIPIGCSFAEKCKIALDVITPQDEFTKCTGVAVEGACGIDISSENSPLGVFNLTIHETNTGLYHGSDSIYKIFLKTKKFTLENLIWADYHLPPLNVHIFKDRSSIIEGKTCKSVNDPHMTSFDGRNYEMQNRDDVYVLYRHQEFDSEVQLQVQSCQNNNNAPRCNCGVAVRSRNDLYVASFCRKSEFQFDFKNCQEKCLTVHRSAKDQFKYKVFFEYGTRVEFKMNKDSMGYVHIKPSNFDQRTGQSTGSVGLCGILDDNQGNDFTNRQGEVVDRMSFIESWRVPSNENYFLLKQPPRVPPQTFKVCVCEPKKDATAGTGIKADLSCETNSVATCLKMVNNDAVVSQESCEVPSRTRRSLNSGHKKPKINLQEETLPLRVKRENNIYDDISAKDFCTTFIENSPSYQTCFHVPNVNPEEAIKNCVLDVVATQDEIWASVNLDAMQSACLTEAISNTTLWVEEQKNKPSIREAIETVVCPLNCSNQGLCDKGFCLCASGFGGSDCSIDINKPPDLTGLWNNGLCDEAETRCTQAYVYGFDFSESNLTCKLEQFFIEEEQHDQTMAETFLVPGRLDTFVEVVCSLEKVEEMNSTKNKFVTGYKISISNNNNLFSRSLELLVFDSACQIFREEKERKIFTLETGFCYIERQCVVAGAPKQSDNSFVCDPSKNPRDWTNTSPVTTTFSPSSQSKVFFSTKLFIISFLLIFF